MCRLCGELIESTPDPEEESRYIAMYCTYARLTGNSEQGRSYAAMLPDEGLCATRSLCLARCCEDETERREALWAYLLSGWGILRDGILQMLVETENTPEDILSWRRKQEQLHALLFDNDDIVRYADFDEYKIAKVLYRAGDPAGTVAYLARCLEIWTSTAPIRALSPLRGDVAAAYALSDDEIKINAEDFIRLVRADFQLLTEAESVNQLLLRAQSIVNG